MAQLGSILQQSRGMASHLDHQELPTINLGLEQIEEGSRRLVKRPGVGESKAGEGSGYVLLRKNRSWLINKVTSSLRHLVCQPTTLLGR